MVQSCQWVGMHAERPGTESVHSAEQSSAQNMPQQHKHVLTMPQALRV